MFSSFPSLPTVIVGNKTDLERKLPFEEIEGTVCLDWECGYAEASAYTGQGVGQVFKELLKQARNMTQVEEVSSQPQIRRYSLLRRLFSREKTKDYAATKDENCKIS